MMPGSRNLELTHSKGRFRFLVVLAFVAVSLPIVSWGAFQSVRGVSNVPSRWVPPHYEQQRQYTQFNQRFHTSEVIIVSWTGCTVDDERLEWFAREIRERTRDRGGGGGLFGRVLTGYSLVRELTGAPEPAAPGSTPARSGHLNRT